MKTIRFSELVKTSGKPAVVTLWAKPSDDPQLMRAVKENRVLTVEQEPASKHKEVSQIGFYQKAHASYLIFPKPLPKNTDLRVVGIKYDLIEHPAVKDPAPKLPARKPPSPSPARKAPRSTQKEFTITVRRIAIIETAVTVSARNEKDASAQALKKAREQPFDPTEAIMREEVRK